MNMKPQTQSAGLGCWAACQMVAYPLSQQTLTSARLAPSPCPGMQSRLHGNTRSGRNLNVRLLTMVAKMSVSAVVVVRMCLHVCPLTMFATGIHLLVSD